MADKKINSALFSRASTVTKTLSSLVDRVLAVEREQAALQLKKQNLLSGERAIITGSGPASNQSFTAILRKVESLAGDHAALIEKLRDALPAARTLADDIFKPMISEARASAVARARPRVSSDASASAYATHDLTVRLHQEFLDSLSGQSPLNQAKNILLNVREWIAAQQPAGAGATA